MTDQPVLKRSWANLQLTPKSWESAGGSAELTATEVIFRPHRINVGVREPIVLDLRTIESVMPIRQRIFGWLPSPLRNAILISGVDGAFAHVLIVSHRGAWIDAIEKARRSLPSPSDRPPIR